MSGSYRPLPSSEPEYPPPTSPTLPPPASARKFHKAVSVVSTKVSRRLLIGGVAAVVVLFVAARQLVSTGPTGSTSTIALVPGAESLYVDESDPASVLAAQLAAANTGRPGQFFRDPTPIRTALQFWELAEQQVKAKGVDTCNDKLGRGLVQAYARHKVDYCGGNLEHIPEIKETHTPWTPSDPEGDDVGDAAIWCTPVLRDDFSKWWGIASAPCLSTNLRPEKKTNNKYYAPRCSKSEDGVALDGEMGRESFLGSALQEGDGPKCKHKVEHTLLFIQRQDQWNPFHVAEDLITTLVTMFIAAAVQPSLVNDRLQLVFTDNYSLSGNHFIQLWSRMGAWSPRRLSVDPWEEGVCLANAIHSVGAGRSLLSTMGVGTSFKCASSITWAASHYYRYLFGLLPQSLHPPPGHTRPMNILWLSRHQLDAYAVSHNDLSPWRAHRVLENEEEVVMRLKRGLNDMCAPDGDGHEIFGPNGCVFEDIDEIPDAWDLASGSDSEPVPVRFASIDPTTLDLERQILFAAHSTIIVSQHGGGLGLSLFLPPGQGAILELQVHAVEGNFHFEHMAYQAGHKYQLLGIEKHINTEELWNALHNLVKDMAGK